MAIGKINRVSNVTASTPVSNTTSISKNLQSQILAKQQNLKKLSTDSALSAEEKAKQTQELQKEIEALKRRLEQIEMKSKESEKEVEKVEAKEEVEKVSEEKENKEDVSFVPKREDTQKTQEAISVEDAQNILHYDLSLKNEMIEQGASYDKENTVRLLSAEIHQDEIRGLDTSKKEEDLKELREKENFWADAKNKKTEQENAAITNPDMQVVIS